MRAKGEQQGTSVELRGMVIVPIQIGACGGLHVPFVYDTSSTMRHEQASLVFFPFFPRKATSRGQLPPRRKRPINPKSCNALSLEKSAASVVSTHLSVLYA